MMSDRGREAFRALPEPAQALVDALAWEFEDAWKEGRKPTLNEWLHEPRAVRLDEEARTALFYWLLRIDIEYRVASHAPTAVTEYQDRFPEFSSVIDDFFESDEAPGFERPGHDTSLPRVVQSAISPYDHPDYEFLGKLGSGATGDIWLAQHRRLRRFEALKFLHGTPFIGEKGRKRFLQEVAALAKLDHENIVRVFSTSSAGGNWFVALEYLDGENLEELVRRLGPLEAPVACALICQAAHGLFHAHKQGLIHRDVKPANLFLTRTDTVKVLDFGLAKWRSQETIQSYETTAGYCLGTPGFMAPEQIGGSERVSAATDAYALGATLFFLLTERPPVIAKTWDEFVRSMQRGDPITSMRELRPDLPEDLCEIVDALLRREPSNRLSSMEEIRFRLSGWASAANLQALIPAEGDAHESMLKASINGTAPMLGMLSPDTERVVRHRASSETSTFRMWGARQTLTVSVGTSILAIALVMGWFLRSDPQDLKVNQGTDRVVTTSSGTQQEQTTRQGAGEFLHNDPIQWTSVTPPWSLVTVAPASSIAALEFSPDGGTLAYGTQGGELRFSDPDTLETIRRLDRNRVRVEAIRWSPDGSLLAVAAGDCLEIWSRSGSLLQTVTAGSLIDEVAWHPYAPKIAIIEKQSVVSIYDTDATLLNRFPVDEYYGTSVVWFPDGTGLITCGGEGNVRFWSESGEPLPGLEGDPARGGTACMTLSKDGILAVGWYAANTCELWKLSTRSKVAEFDFPRGVGLISFSPDRKRLLGLFEGHTELFELDDSLAGDVLVRSMKLPSVNDSVAWRVGPKEQLAVGGAELRLLHSNGSEVKTLAAHEHTSLLTLARSRANDRFATGDNRGHVTIWDSEAKLLHSIEAHEGEVTALVWSPDGVWLASAGSDGWVKIWNDVGESKAAWHHHSQDVRHLAWSNSGDWLASGGDDQLVRLSHPEHGTGPILRNEGRIVSLAWSADDSLLAAGLAGLVGIQVRTRESGFRAFTLLQGVLRDHVHGLHFAPSGLQLAAGASYGSAALFNLERGTHRRLDGLRDAVFYTRWDPSGNLIAGGGNGRNAAVWDKEGRGVAILSDVAAIKCLEWSPDGKWIAVGDRAGCVRIVSKDWRNGIVVSGNLGVVSGLTWDSNSTRLTFCTEGGFVRIYDVAAQAVSATSLVLPNHDIVQIGGDGRLKEGDEARFEGLFLYGVRSDSGALKYETPTEYRRRFSAE